MSRRMTIAQAEAAGLIENKPTKPRKKKLPQPTSKGEEMLALHLKANKV